MLGLLREVIWHIIVFKGGNLAEGYLKMRGRGERAGVGRGSSGPASSEPLLSSSESAAAMLNALGEAPGRSASAISGAPSGFVICGKPPPPGKGGFRAP